MKDGMVVINKSVKRIRGSDLYWTAIPKLEKIFVERARKFNISCIKKLVTDFKTRCNSTYFILESTLSYKALSPHLK